MSPLRRQQNRKIVLLELLTQLGHGIGAGLTDIGSLCRRNGILEVGPHFLLPFDLHVSQQVGQLTGRSLPEARGGIGQIRIPARRGGAFPCLSLLAFHFEDGIVGLPRVADHGISHLADSTSCDLRDRGRIKGPLVGQRHCIDADGLNLIQLGFLFDGQIIAVGPGGEGYECRNDRRQDQTQQSHTHGAPPHQFAGNGSKYSC